MTSAEAPSSALPNPGPRPREELDELRRIWTPPRGWRFLTAINNNYVGVAYVATAFLFFVLAGILALIMRTQLAVPEQRLDRAEPLQPALHDARHGHDVPLRRAGGRSDGRAAAAEHAGRARSAVSAAFRVCVLGLRDRRPRVLRQHLLRSRAARRLVHVSAAHDRAVFAGLQRGFLAARHRLHRDLGDRRRDRDHRRRAAHARARHDARSHADLRVGDARLRGDDRVRVSRRDPRDDAARARARVPLAFLYRGARRRSAAVAAPLLVLRPSRGLHHLPARRGHGVDDRADDGAAAARRLPAGRARADRHRLPELRAVGASHVRDRHPAALARRSSRRRAWRWRSRAAFRFSRGSRRSRAGGCSGRPLLSSCSASS